MGDQKRPSVGVAVFIWRGDEFIMYERRGSHGHGTWSVPGGHLEFGETWEDCAKREAMEELGITIKDVHLLAVTNDVFPDDDKHYISIWVRAELDQGEPRSMEPTKVIGVEWRNFKNLPSPLFEPCWTNLRATHPNIFEV